MIIKGGKIGEGKQAQHVDIHRKITLRRTILRRAGLEAQRIEWEVPDLAAWVPYCGDGDLAVELEYGHRFAAVLGNDLDPKRVETFTRRVAAKHVEALVADADAGYPDFHDDRPVALADLDAYSYPYDALRSLLGPGGPRLARRLVVFLTDAQRMSIFLNGTYRNVAGDKVELGSNRGAKPDPKAANARRSAMTFYWPKHVRPAVLAMLADAGFTKLVAEMQYRRGQMLYAGLVVDQPVGVRVTSRRSIGPLRDVGTEARL